METTCINLRERFGRRFKVTYEESYAAAYGPKATRDDPWLQIIPGARGHVYPHSAAMLAASTNRSGPTARRLKALPFVQVYTEGSDGVTVLFPPDHLDLVNEVGAAGIESTRDARRLHMDGIPFPSQGQGPSLLQFALEYHRRGWSLIPVKPGTKKPACPWKRFQTIRPTEKRLREWFGASTYNALAVSLSRKPGLTFSTLGRK